MYFPWNKYEEIKVERRNTLQVFITNKCNLSCKGCFARNIMKDKEQFISLEEYERVLKDFLNKGGKQINLLGGEPFLHPQLHKLVEMNCKNNIKTTIYTNGYFLNNYDIEYLYGATIRVSIYNVHKEKYKSLLNLPECKHLTLDFCYMVSKDTYITDLISAIQYIERNFWSGVFFISSIRELDNPRKEFFDDTDLSMPVIQYKELVHRFLDFYQGDMEIHISKRGVFESTLSLAENKCIFSNYFIGGKVIQCPYDIVNSKFQSDYSFGTRFCRQSSTCLMNKIILKRKEE